MICENGCGKRMTLMHPVIVDGKKKYVCTNCKIIMQRVGQAIDEQVERNFAPYILKWKLRDNTDGKEWIEEHKEMNLNDVEVVYGNNVYEILWMIVRKENEAVI